MGVDHVCDSASPRKLSCDTCNKYIRERLLSVGVQGFRGKDSMSPHVRAFLNTGEPELARRDVPIDGLGLDG